MKLPRSRDRSFRCSVRHRKFIEMAITASEGPEEPRFFCRHRAHNGQDASLRAHAWAIFCNPDLREGELYADHCGIIDARLSKPTWDRVRLSGWSFWGWVCHRDTCSVTKQSCVSSSRLTILPGSLRAGWREPIGETRSITQRVQIASFIGIRKQFAFCSPLNPLSLLLKRCVRR